LAIAIKQKPNDNNYSNSNKERFHGGVVGLDFQETLHFIIKKAS